MLGESLHCYLAYLPAEVVLALLPLQLQRMTGLTFSERLNSILLWVQTASNSINNDWLLTAFKAQQTLFPSVLYLGELTGKTVIPHLALCGSLGQQAPGSTGRNPASSQLPPAPSQVFPDALQPFSEVLGNLHCSLHKDSLCK